MDTAIELVASLPVSMITMRDRMRYVLESSNDRSQQYHDMWKTKTSKCRGCCGRPTLARISQFEARSLRDDAKARSIRRQGTCSKQESGSAVTWHGCSVPDRPYRCTTLPGIYPDVHQVSCALLYVAPQLPPYPEQSISLRTACTDASKAFSLARGGEIRGYGEEPLLVCGLRGKVKLALVDSPSFWP